MIGISFVIFSFVILNFSRLENPNMQLNTVLFASVAVSHLRLGLSYTKGQDFHLGIGSLTLLRGEPTPADWKSIEENNRFFRHIGILQGSDFSDWLDLGFDWNYYIAPYLHHPPGIGLLIAAIHRMTGLGLTISSINALSALMHLGSLLMFMAIVWRYEQCVRLTLLAGWIFVVAPISAIYGRQISYEITTLFFSFITLWVYTWITEKKSRWEPWQAGLLALAAFVNCFSDWSAFFFLFSLWCLEIWRRRRFTIIAGVLTGAVATASIVIAWQLWAAAGGSFERIIYGLNTKTTQLFNFYSPTGLVKHLAYQHALLGFTIPVVILAVIGLFLFIYQDKTYWPRRKEQFWIWSFLATACLYCGLFIKGAADLIYWHMFFLPVEAYLSARVLQLIWRARATRGPALSYWRVPVVAAAILGIYFNAMGYACYDFYQPQKYTYGAWAKIYINSFNVHVWQTLKNFKKRI
ncbi:MAG: hypothetical protein HY547_08105 [Elusimicrobia bacterium]|nr:hypothetical protein [Elusimicrobiota bacterium]